MNNGNLMRKIHIYVGLFFFLQFFLFAASGFMLNHRWKPWNNFDERIETQNEIHVPIPVRGTNLEKANAVLESLGVEGEINGLFIEPEKDLMIIVKSIFS